MAQSPLLGADRAPERPRGTSTDLLGPSDTSDTGSDLVGAVGAVDTDAIGLSGGTNDDVARTPGAGADVGDTNLDADSDSGGTGERAAAGRDTEGDLPADIAPDRVIGAGSDEALVSDEDDLDDLSASSDDDDDEDRLASDIDDGATAQPPGRRAMPPQQRNTDRPVAGNERGTAPRGASGGAERDARNTAARRDQKGPRGDDPISESDKAIDA